MGRSHIEIATTRRTNLFNSTRLQKSSAAPPDSSQIQKNHRIGSISIHVLSPLCVTMTILSIERRLFPEFINYETIIGGSGY